MPLLLGTPGAGYLLNMEAVTTIRDVRTFETQGGNVRYVVRDADGKEYTTFREAIGDSARALAGRRVRIGYHEVQRGKYTNVYLDKVEPLDGEPRTAESELHETLKPFKDKVAEDIKEGQED